MKAIIIQSEDGKIQVSNVPLPILGYNEVLIKNDFSQINPADINILSFSYKERLKNRSYVVLGMEGVGTIVKVGNKSLNSLLGRRVCYISRDGTWAEYSKTELLGLNFIDDVKMKENEVVSYVNPLTAMCMLDATRQENQKFVVQTGASSSCGKMFIKLCKRTGIKTINVVRRKEQIEELLGIGADYVLVQSDTNFKSEFKRLMNQLQPKVCFECISGELSGIVFNMLPNNSIMYQYGSMSLQPLRGISPVELIYNHKDIKHFNFLSYAMKIKDRLPEILNEMSENFRECLGSKVSKVYLYEQINSALEFYKNNMTLGKVLLKSKF